MKKLCDLCNGVPAAIYCPSDSALLCFNCDAKVHAANFLVARHLRSIVCSNCTTLVTSTFSGYPNNNNSLCNSCLDQDSSSDCISSTDHDHQSSSSSSSKHNSSSTTTTTTTTNNNNNNDNKKSSKCNLTRYSSSVSVDWKAEAILINWWNKLVGITTRNWNGNVVEVACHAFGMCNTTRMKLTGVPYRVGLAASLWLSLRLYNYSESEQRLQLKRLEEICGVPSKLIVAAHSKLARIIKINIYKQGAVAVHHHRLAQEGWAESS